MNSEKIISSDNGIEPQDSNRSGNSLSKIEEVLESQIRPMIRSHGGDIQFKDFEDGVVYVDLTGACAGCAAADLSTKGFVEDTLRAAIPEVNSVELDHPASSELMDFARKILRGEVKQ